MNLRDKMIAIFHEFLEDDEPDIPDYVDDIMKYIKDVIDGKEI